MFDGLGPKRPDTYDFLLSPPPEESMDARQQQPRERRENRESFYPLHPKKKNLNWKCENMVSRPTQGTGSQISREAKSSLKSGYEGEGDWRSPELRARIPRIENKLSL